MKNNFCVLPFNSLEISPDGTCKVCCKIDANIKKDDGKDFNVLYDKLDDIWNSKNINQLRDNFNNNRRSLECWRCWTEESSQIKSLRLQVIDQKFNQFNPEIVYLSLKLSNKCNLACRICSPDLSSLWQSQFKKLNRPLTPVEMFKTIDLDKFEGDRLQSLHDISKNLTRLLIYGGEPLINDEIITYLEYLVDSGISRNIQLILNTNGTVYSDKLTDVFRKFKKVNLFLSIDDIGKRFEYQRWPAKWDKIHNNISKYVSMKDEINLEFYPTVSVLNICNIEEILARLTTYNIPITFNNILHEPKLLSIRNLPMLCKNKLIDDISSINFTKFNLNRQYFDAKSSLISFIQLPNNDEWDLNKEEYLKEFVRRMTDIDNLRQTPIKDFLPDLWNLLNDN